MSLSLRPAHRQPPLPHFPLWVLVPRPGEQLLGGRLSASLSDLQSWATHGVTPSHHQHRRPRPASLPPAAPHLFSIPRGFRSRSAPQLTQAMPTRTSQKVSEVSPGFDENSGLFPDMEPGAAGTQDGESVLGPLSVSLLRPSGCPCSLPKTPVKPPSNEPLVTVLPTAHIADPS